MQTGLVKLKLPFEQSGANIGVLQVGSIKDGQNTYKLKPMTKYRVQLNPKGKYDLMLISAGQSKQLASLEMPFVINADQADSAVYFGETWYRGQVEITQSLTGPIAINKLDLEAAIWGLLGPMVKLGSSADSIKASAVIMRSSLLSLMFSQKDQDEYHLNGSTLSFKGLDWEKDFVSRLVRETEGEVLFSARGEILFTPFRTAVSEGSQPVEMIGSTRNAWEKVFSLKQIETALNLAGVNTGPIISLKQVNSSLLSKAGSKRLIVQIDGLNGIARLEMAQAQSIFGLPSSVFRIYSFYGEDGDPYIQFIGGLPYHSRNMAAEPLLNMVRLIHESSPPNESYKNILKRMYPEAYLGRV